MLAAPAFLLALGAVPAIATPSPDRAPAEGVAGVAPQPREDGSRKRGFIIVEKRTEPSGVKQKFTFESNYHNPPFKLRDGHSKHSGALVPGTYWVREVVPDGWNLKSATCDDGSAPEAINLSAGETVTCTFTNRPTEVPPGRIRVRKVAPTDPAQAFGFTGAITTTLRHDETSAFVPVGAGTHTVTETIPPGWQNPTISCNDANSTGSGATATFRVAPGEDVTCTFTNRPTEVPPGRLEVRLFTSPTSSQTFSFTTDFATFALTDGGTYRSAPLAPGKYDVTQDAPPGWFIATLNCGDQQGVRTSRTVTCDVRAGQTAVATFVNTATPLAAGELPPATIIVQKRTEPPGADEFTVRATGSLTGVVPPQDIRTNAADGTGHAVFVVKAPDSYALSESDTDGWRQQSAICEGGSSPSRVTLRPGETITCTFTNVAQPVVDPRQGIVVRLGTIPAGADQLFTVRPSWGPAFALRHGVSRDSGLLEPGPHRVSVDVPQGWSLTFSSCSDGSRSDAIDLDRDETVTCAFTFTQGPPRPRIFVRVETEPAASDRQFPFLPSYGAFFLLGHGESAASGPLRPGVYSVREFVPPGWDLIPSCSNGDAPDAIRLLTEDVVCTFRNEARVDVAVEAIASPEQATVEDLITVTVTASSVGTAPADDVVVVVTAPENTTSVGHRPEVFQPETGRWSVGSLAAGEHLEIELTYRAEGEVSGDAFTAVAEAPRDVNPANDRAEAPVTVVGSAAPLLRPAIVGTVCVDSEPGDGRQQPGEGLVKEARVVALTGPGGPQTATLFHGGFRFTSLALGEYTVAIGQLNDTVVISDDAAIEIVELCEAASPASPEDGSE